MDDFSFCPACHSPVEATDESTTWKCGRSFSEDANSVKVPACDYIATLRVEQDKAHLALKNVRGVAAKYQRRCKKHDKVCDCAHEISQHVHRLVEPVIGPVSIFRSAGA